MVIIAYLLVALLFGPIVACILGFQWHWIAGWAAVLNLVLIIVSALTGAMKLGTFLFAISEIAGITLWILYCLGYLGQL